jgi:3-hydroxybutyryl-CoA dehydrogenase
LSASLAILGPGSLGLSFARHAAQQGFRVHLAGRSRRHVEDRLDQARHQWARSSTDPCEATPPGATPWQELILPCTDLAEVLPYSEALLEALPEDPVLKASCWRDLDAVAPPGLLRLTGTSSLSVESLRLAAGMQHWLLGFHLFIPVHRMRMVELVSEAPTPADLRTRAAHLGTVLGLRVVQVKDQFGFAAARMALVQGLEAMRLLEKGVASAEDLDALMVCGYGHPTGPLELSDRIGLGLRLSIADGLHKETGDTRFEAPAILRELVQCGHTGRKAGRGFYLWDEGGKRQ